MQNTTIPYLPELRKHIIEQSFWDTFVANYLSQIRFTVECNDSGNIVENISFQHLIDTQGKLFAVELLDSFYFFLYAGKITVGTKHLRVSCGVMHGALYSELVRYIRYLRSGPGKGGPGIVVIPEAKIPTLP